MRMSMKWIVFLISSSLFESYHRSWMMFSACEYPWISVDNFSGIQTIAASAYRRLLWVFLIVTFSLSKSGSRLSRMGEFNLMIYQKHIRIVTWFLFDCSWKFKTWLATCVIQNNNDTKIMIGHVCTIYTADFSNLSSNHNEYGKFLFLLLSNEPQGKACDRERSKVKVIYLLLSTTKHTFWSCSSKRKNR